MMKRAKALGVVLWVIILVCGMIGAVAEPAEECAPFSVAWYTGEEDPMEVYSEDTVVVVDKEATPVIITTTVPLTDVSLEEILLQEEHVYADPWYAVDVMIPGQVIVLQGYMGEIIPRWRISGVTEEGTMEQWFIAESGEDGSLLLIPCDPAENGFTVEVTEEAQR